MALRDDYGKLGVKQYMHDILNFVKDFMVENNLTCFEVIGEYKNQDLLPLKDFIFTKNSRLGVFVEANPTDKQWLVLCSKVEPQIPDGYNLVSYNEFDYYQVKTCEKIREEYPHSFNMKMEWKF